jgi:NADH-ubiquinone/plastoquinone oxidoreductase subunit 4L
MNHPLTTDLIQVLFLAAAMVSIGIFAIAWRRDLAAALAGIPLLFAGAGIAFVGVARFSARAAAAVQPANSPRIIVGVSGPPLGQEAAVLIAIAALAAVALGVALAARAGRLQGSAGESSR